VRVIVYDPAQELHAPREHQLAATAVEVVAVGSLHHLTSPLRTAGAEDVLVAHVWSDHDCVALVDYVRQHDFDGHTVFVVNDRHDLGCEKRLGVPRAESVLYSATVLDAVFGGLGRRTTPSPSKSAPTFHGLIGRSKAIKDVFARVEKAAAGDANVCIYGESGTGKELIARAIHVISDRRNGPLVTFDCAAVPEGLAESQLFGHVRGAFTGAIENRDGVFEQANNGTLFIDELCELTMPLQAKLLRVIQGHEFVKVGGTRATRTNVRFITATNKDPKQAVDSGVFRADLYYRVAVVTMRMPPLRERREDIPLLVEHFVARYSLAYKKHIRAVQPFAMDRMINLPWPGNIRQLENFLAQAIVLAEGDVLTERDLFIDDAVACSAPAAAVVYEPGMSLREVERMHILSTLKRVGGNRSEAARLLGISIRGLQYRLKTYAAEQRPADPPGPRVSEPAQGEIAIDRL
jgi:DNA-binding NtrC family response regulator